MKLFFAQLRNILTAFAVGSMSAIVLVVPAGMGVAPANAVGSYYLCHATGNADSHTEVKNWVYTEPNGNGDAMGHAGDGHQNGLDIIPPIPELDFPGQNWDTYGQQVHELGCKVPVTVSVTFTDNRCDGTTYVAPTMSAPDVDGTQKSVTGSVAPGSTVTVTYTAKQGYGIIGDSTFTHTYPALPSSAAYCDRPTDQIVHDSRTACDLSEFGSFQPGTIRRTGTREYVWNTSTQQWVLEPESGIAWNAWTQVEDDKYSDQEFFDNNCGPTQPPAEQVHDSRENCDLSQFGDFEPGVIRRTGEREYVWNLADREWQLEPMADVTWGNWTQPADDVYTDQEFFDNNCGPTQPQAEARSDSQEGCDLTGYGDFEAGIIRRTGEQVYVWNLTERAWELSTTVDWNAWTQAEDDVYTDNEFELECSGDQPPAEPVSDSRTNCDLTGYGDFEPGTIRRTGEQEYVWNLTARAWELEPMDDILWADWTQTADDVYTDQEFFDNCGPTQPPAEPRSDSQEACDLTGYGDFEAGIIRRTGEQVYVWNLTERAWELSTTVDWNSWTQAEDDVYTDQEYFEACAPVQPPSTTVYDTQEGCDLAQFGEAFESGVIRRTGEREYVWNLAERDWELEDMTAVSWNDWTQGDDDAYTDQEYFDNCAPVQPADLTVTETQTACDLTGFGDFEPGTITRSGDREFLWNTVTRDWEPEPMANVSWNNWTQAEDDIYTDQEYFETCAPEQPVAATVDDSQEGCVLSEFGEDFEAGVIRRTGDREYVWNLTARAWELEPMADVAWADWTQAEDDVYTDEEYAVLCSGEQPDPLPVDDTTSGCDLTSFGDFEAGVINRDGLQEYVWNATTRGWVLEPTGDIEWGAWTQSADDAYTDEEYFANCVLPRPADLILDEELSGCDLTEFGEFDAGTIRRTGAREFVWNLAERDWELEDLSEVSWADWTQVAEDVLTDEEYFEDCATGQPAAEIRQTSGTEDSCALQGTLSWTDTFTTEYVWDAELRTWVPGEEGEPVREEQLEEWSFEKYERLCLEVAPAEGEVQVMDHELDAEVEVKGVQQTAAPTAAVPTAVDAGLGATPFTPVGVGRNPLALVALGGGLLLLGAAGRRKGATAVR